MSVHEDTLQGLNDALAYVKGDKKKGRSRTRELNVTPLRAYTKEEIKEIRTKSHLTQTVFAAALGVSPKTVEAWESGRTQPGGSTIRIFQMMEKKPEILEEYNILKNL